MSAGPIAEKTHMTLSRLASMNRPLLRATQHGRIRHDQAASAQGPAEIL